ncbi:SAM-dependent methyltransferase [Streptomyces sp. NPDC018000]|uniref:SAM-dependent methyltransferase n=1 Tax=Streptomyces sp. NPDC018000 TaxID=3365028 RepID=UPI0037A49EE0
MKRPDESAHADVVSAVLPSLTPTERIAYGWLLKSSLGRLAPDGKVPSPEEPDGERVNLALRTLARLEVADPVAHAAWLSPEEVRFLRQAEGMMTPEGPLDLTGRPALSPAAYRTGLHVELLQVLEESFGKLLPMGTAEIVEGLPDSNPQRWLDVKSFAVQAYMTLQADAGAEMEIYLPQAGIRRTPLRVGQVLALHSGVVPHAVIGNEHTAPVSLLRHSYLPQTLVPRTAHLVQTPERVTTEIVRLAGLSHHSLFVDIGCGDATVLLDVCKATGACGLGLELDPQTAAAARSRIAKAGMQHAIRITEGAMEDARIKRADVLFAFLNPETNDELRKRIEERKISGSLLMTYGWPMRGWTPTDVHVMHLPDVTSPVCLYIYSLEHI